MAGRFGGLTAGRFGKLTAGRFGGLTAGWFGGLTARRVGNIGGSPGRPGSAAVSRSAARSRRATPHEDSLGVGREEPHG